MKNMKRFISSIIVFIALVSSASADRLVIPSGSLPWSTLRDTYLNVMTAELYTYLGATGGELPATPTFDGMIIRGSGNSWIQVYNNTAWTDTLTGLGGFGILDWHPYTILNGSPERLALFSEIGGGETIQDDDPTLASATGKYYSRASGGYFNVVHGVEMFAIAGTRTADETDPVIGGITPSALTHDGTGVSLSATIASVTETNEDDREWSLYDVTAGAIVGGWTTFTGLSITGITIPADQHTYRLDVRCTDLAGNVGSVSSANIVYEAVAGGYEDFTTFTETDSGGDITVSTNAVTVDTILKQANSSVAKSYGIDSIGSFSHTVDFNLADIPATTPNYVIWAVGNEAGMTYTDLSTAANGLMVYAVNISGENRLFIRNNVSATTSAKIVIATGTAYYLRIIRNNDSNVTGLTLYTSDVDRQNNTNGTYVAVTHTDATCQYIGVAGSYDATGTTSSTFVVSNLKIE